MTPRIAVFAATRADLSPLASVLRALTAAADLDPVLLAPRAALDRNDDAWRGVVVEELPALDARDHRMIIESGLRLGAAVAEVVERVTPAAFVVLGDRWELLYAVPPAVLLGVPIVHLHGGEVTEGAIDDRIRHAVTKLADLHCTSTEAAAARVRQLGEAADRVVVTGAPSLDSFVAVRPADDARLSTLLGQPLVRPFALVTYHPPTAGGPAPADGARNVLDAVAATVGTALITHPGLDHGREQVVTEIERAVSFYPQLVAVQALGAEYLPVLAGADVVVGNSSSGILEAASFGVPVVNVGDRQRGRVSGVNVVDVPETRGGVENGVRTALTPAFRAIAHAAVNIYGDGKAAPRIADVIRRAAAGGLERKPFVDCVGAA